MGKKGTDLKGPEEVEKGVRKHHLLLLKSKPSGNELLIVVTADCYHRKTKKSRFY